MGPIVRTPRLPSLRVSAALAAGMLALGVAIGAAIGPAPSPSLAGEPLAQLLPRIAALAVAGAADRRGSTATTAPPAVTPQPTPSPAASNAASASAGAGAAEPSATQTAPGASSSPPSKTTPTGTSQTGGGNGAKPKTSAGGEPTTKPLPPVTRVWLITLSGATFTQALAQTSAAPYIDTQLAPAGALLANWSALQGSALANEAALLGGEPPQTVDSIVQPPCPEGAAGTQCKAETPGALTAADDFLKQTVPAIISNETYREHGLVVIVFGTIGNAASSGLPEGSATATLSSEPPGGVLILSPFARAGTRPSTAYDPTSPRQSLSGLLHS